MLHEPYPEPFVRVLPAYQKRTGLPTCGSALYNIAMSTHRFADFLERLQAEGRLVRRDEAAARRFEIGARAEVSAPCAVLLTNVANSPFPLIHGVFSSSESILSALGSGSFAEAAARIDGILTDGRGGGWLERLGGDTSGPLRKYEPKTLRTGPSQQIVHLGADVDLSGLPVPTFAVGEMCPVLTAGRLIARECDGSRLYVGRQEFRVLDSNRLVACWRPSSQPARLLAHCRRRGETMPLALAFGGDPIDLLTAMAPLPCRADVLALTGCLRGGACEMIAGRRVDLPIPADAELVLEGTIDPNEPCVDPGQGLDPAGQLRPLRPGPVVHIEAITRRPTPLFPSLLPDEKAGIHRALAKVFLPFLRRELPGLVHLSFPTFGGDRLCAFASIDKTYAGQAGQFANAFWGCSEMSPVRYLVVVDEDVDVDNSDDVWAVVSAHALPGRDVTIGDAPPDEFVHDQPPGRMVIDATRPLP